ncbi:MAG: FtsQ-type POTRA domain-containing protein [Clostridia bacterium]|nr:FtsQ-type POTRA domain-containing protein [Clostridia bacterium]
MKKSKGQTIDSFYTSKKETTKKTKTKKRNNVGVNSARSSKDKKTTPKKKKKTNNEDNKIINIDNEIIIGLTPKNNVGVGPVATHKTKKPKNKKTVGANSVRPTKNKKINSKKKTANKKQNQKNKTKNKIIKWIILLLLLLTAIVFFMLSSVFNIKQIIVTNNSKVSSEEIINLSTLTPGVNIFKTTNNVIRNNLKMNPYIENVKVKRNLNGTVTLEVEERKATYILKFANAYVYINNQGYMLEMSENPLELPMITGFETPAEEINEGNRLAVGDLKKLEDVIKIMEAAKNISMDKLITAIDITDWANYKLTISSEGKTVQFGDCSNANIKLLKVQAVIEKEKGIEGEIYFQDLEKTVFREKV